MTKKEFAELRSKLLNNDQEAFHLLYEEHAQSSLSWLVSKYHCPQHEARDIFVEAVLSLRERIMTGQTNEISNVRGYLLSTCKNMWLMQVRKEKKMDQARMQYSRDRELVDEIWAFTDEKLNLIEITRKALLTLTENCQQLLKAYYFDQLSFDEMALRFGLANANVAKSSKSRCFRKLVEEVRIYQGQS